MSSSAIKRAGNEEAAARLSLEKKACLDGIMKKAELLVESEEVQKKRLAVVAGNQVTYVAGVLWNETTGPLTLSYIYINEGSIFIEYPPDPLLVNVEGDFYIRSGDDGVVEAVIVYSGTNEAGFKCDWGLYFYADANGTTRVSVWCGPIGNFLNKNKDEIKEKIKRDGKNSYYSDLGAQSAYMYADISNTSPGNYAVGAYYYAS